MARVWVTGSADGIGRETAARLIARGHQVIQHARDDRRAKASALPGAVGTVVADLSTAAGIRDAAAQAAGYAPDAVVHNAGVLLDDRREVARTSDGLELTFAVNVLAPWLLTALLPGPRRLVYLSSQMHHGGRPDFADLQWTARRYDGSQAYRDSKLMVTAIALATAAAHPDVRANAVDPGWVRTRMGGPGAPRTLADGAAGPVRLAVDDDVPTGAYLTGGRPAPPHPLAADPTFQAAVDDACATLSG